MRRPASAFNEHQVRHVVATFAHVDNLLQAIEKLARSEVSPFSRERPDLSPDEGRLLLSFTELARARMLAALDRLGIPRPVQTISARWSVETTLRFADIALSELGAGNLRGYGPVDEDIATELTALAADLRAVVTRTGAMLREQDAGGLAERLAAVRGPIGDVLRTVERISTAHGLAEVRPLLAAAAERAVGTTFDVGVFGRVSAGKSSLINALLGLPILPVGATPVTAVPLRIQRGPAGAVVHRVSGAPEPIALDAIADFATEEQNPGNRAGVRSIEISVPVVAPGLRLLDTPGIGSLSSSGPAQTFAWLPRCDLGLVLVAAGSAVAREDLALVSGLIHAGIACSVLVSKADLLSPAELGRALKYVKTELTSALGPGQSVDVYAVSTTPGHEARLAAFREEVLEPFARDHAHASARALRARLHRLVGATAAAMSGRSGGADDRVVALGRARTHAADVVRREADQLGSAAPRVLDAAAEAVAVAWQRGEDGRETARTAILHAANTALAAVRSAADEVRATVPDAAEAESRRLPPLFDPELLDAIPSLPPPGLGRRLIGRTLVMRRLEPLAEPLASALQRYGSRLYAWGMGFVEEYGGAGWDAAGSATIPPHSELARLDRMIDDTSMDAGATTAQ